MSDEPNNSQEEQSTYRRRTIMGLLAAAGATGAMGTATADEHWVDDEDDDLEEEWLPADASEAHVAVLTGNQADVETAAGGCVHVTPQEENVLLFDLVLEDIQCVTQAHIHEGARGEEGPVVAPLLEYTEEMDGSGEGDPLTTTPETPLIEGATVDDPDLVQAILADPEDYYVNVHTVHNPEGEIRGQIRGFDMGQETDIEPVPAEFLVSNLDPVDVTVTQGDLIDVSATVRNAGDVTATQTVEFRIDGDVIADASVELRCRESVTITFEDIDTADLEPGEYEHGVFTEDDSETGTLTVQTPPEFLVSNLDPVDVTVTQGDLIDVSADIENVGEATGTQTIEFRIDDDVVEEEELELDGGQTETVTFDDIDTADLEPGEYEHGVFSEDDSETGTLTVEEEPTAAEFLVSNLDPVDVTVTQGDLIDVSADIENVGEEIGTQTIEFRIDDDVVEEEELELDGGQTETVTFEEIDTADLEPGEYEHGVFTEDDSETGTLTVEEEPIAAEFLVSNLDPVDVTVTQGDLLDVSADIENVGGETGTQTIEFRIDGDVVEEEELELDGGQTETVTFEEIDTVDLEPEEYEHGVFSEDDSETGTLTVEADDPPADDPPADDPPADDPPADDPPADDPPADDTPAADVP